MHTITHRASIHLRALCQQMPQPCTIVTFASPPLREVTQSHVDRIIRTARSIPCLISRCRSRTRWWHDLYFNESKRNIKSAFVYRRCGIPVVKNLIHCIWYWIIEFSVCTIGSWKCVIERLMSSLQLSVHSKSTDLHPCKQLQFDD